MYTIYKYEWDHHQRLGSLGAEIVIQKGNTFMCYFDTKEGPDMRLLNSKDVAEYMPPSKQEYATVYTSRVPFYGLGQLKKTLSRGIYIASMWRLLGRPRKNRQVRDLAQAYTWEPVQTFN